MFCVFFCNTTSLIKVYSCHCFNFCVCLVCRWSSRDHHQSMSGLLSAPSLSTSLPGIVSLMCSPFFTIKYCRVLPVPLIMIPFGVIAQQYKMVDRANSCSCWYPSSCSNCFHGPLLLLPLGVCHPMGMYFLE